MVASYNLSTIIFYQFIRETMVEPKWHNLSIIIFHQFIRETMVEPKWHNSSMPKRDGTWTHIHTYISYNIVRVVRGTCTHLTYDSHRLPSKER